jgi:hypothetical protein
LRTALQYPRSQKKVDVIGRRSLPAEMQRESLVNSKDKLVQKQEIPGAEAIE